MVCVHTCVQMCAGDLLEGERRAVETEAVGDRGPWCSVGPRGLRATCRALRKPTPPADGSHILTRSAGIPMCIKVSSELWPLVCPAPFLRNSRPTPSSSLFPGITLGSLTNRTNTDISQTSKPYPSLVTYFSVAPWVTEKVVGMLQLCLSESEVLPCLIKFAACLSGRNN